MYNNRGVNPEFRGHSFCARITLALLILTMAILTIVYTRNSDLYKSCALPINNYLIFAFVASLALVIILLIPGLNPDSAKPLILAFFAVVIFYTVVTLYGLNLLVKMDTKYTKCIPRKVKGMFEFIIAANASFGAFAVAAAVWYFLA